MPEIYLPMIPVPKGRPKFTIMKGASGDFVKVYTPKKTVDAENKIKSMMLAVGFDPIEKGTPIFVDLEFGMPIPKSATKKQVQSGHIKKPDIDNLAKTVLDAMNGLIYHDDSQITSLEMRKIYAENPYIQIIFGASK